jgi:multidrug efflux pump subunit AcrA (membrane-fusion protein)
MATKVVMEALSPTMEEGRLVEWKKAEGEAVATGDVLAEVETDKAVMELVARADDVRGQHVAGELDALEMQAERFRQHVRERGLADARQVFDQQVAARDEAGEREPHLRFLAEDHFACGSDEALERRLRLGRFQVCFQQHGPIVQGMI